jgi:hypothetical protein
MFPGYVIKLYKALMNLGVIRGHLYRSDNRSDLRKLFNHLFSLPPPVSNSYHDLASSQKNFLHHPFSLPWGSFPVGYYNSLLHGQSSHHIPHTTYCQIYTRARIPTKNRQPTTQTNRTQHRLSANVTGPFWVQQPPPPPHKDILSFVPEVVSMTT